MFTRVQSRATPLGARASLPAMSGEAVKKESRRNSSSSDGGS
jgi:hypothetical protein